MTGKLLIGAAVGGTLLAVPLVQRTAPPARVMQTLIVSLDGSEPEFTDVDNGVLFDLDADGEREAVAWTLPGRPHAFLAIDEGRDGRIRNGYEILGASSGPPDGFTYLRVFDGFQGPEDLAVGRAAGLADGVIDEDDALFHRLILWTDLNHDGESQETELQSLAYAGFRQIDLNPLRYGVDDASGNHVATRSVAVHRTLEGTSLHRPLVAVRLSRSELTSKSR